MKIMMEFLKSDTASALGWALIHSIWQGLLIWLLVLALLRWPPALYGRLRYAIACGGFLVLTASVLATFLYLHPTSTHPGAYQPLTHPAFFMMQEEAPALSPESSLLTTLPLTLQRHMPWILLAWVAGLSFFSFRFMGGLFYLGQIRSSAIPITNEWNSYLRQACRELGIHHLVTLAESTLITTPVVIGYLKPVILTPLGMFTGLSSEQLQTIILHELAHIRRHDYLINLVQSVIETILFFNPFIWSISTIIRKEREYCCDDLVVRHHGDARAYAYALTLLAERKLSGHAFALSLADDRNQLLHRIKRMMRTSTTNHTLKNRIIIPLVLLGAGLFSISWLGIQAPDQDRHSGKYNTEKNTVSQNSNKSARYSRRSIITIDKNGQPHEDILESFEGDEALRPLLKKIPSPPGQLIIPTLPPDIHGGAIAPLDTIPPHPVWKTPEQWETFAREFEENFKKNFQGLEEMFALRENDSLFMQQFETDWIAPFHLNIPLDSLERHWMQKNDHALKALEQELKRFYDAESGDFRKLRESLEKFEHRSDETSLVDQLREDGYLSENETLETLEWSEDVFKVNGREVNQEDERKYRRWFERSSVRRLE